MDIDYNLDDKSKKMVVSDNFVDIYKNFNVSSQEGKMKRLTRSELYLLIVLCLDKHSEEDPVCINNFKPFISEVQEIYDLQDDKVSLNTDILYLIDKTDDKYIDVDIIVDCNNNKLSNPLERNQVRNEKLNNIIDGNSSNQ